MPQFHLAYLSHSPLMSEFIAAIKKLMPPDSIKETCLSRIGQLKKEDKFLIDIQHSRDIETLKVVVHEKRKPIVLISQFAYLRQVLMEQTYPIIFPDFTEYELSMVIHKCFSVSPIADRIIQVHDEELDTPLTDREIQLMDTLSQGLLYKEIAFQLGISIGTVKQHCHKIYGKLNVSNRTEAINKLGMRME